MRNLTGYIVLLIAGSIYISFNFVVTSYVVILRPELTYNFGSTFFAELIAFIPIAFLFIGIRTLYKWKRQLFHISSYRSVGIHLLLLSIFILIHSIWQVFFNHIILGADFDMQYIQRDILIFLNIRVLIYIITIALVIGIVKIEERENKLLKQSELKLQIQKTNFRELELKLNPAVIYPNFDFIKANAFNRPDDSSSVVLNLSKQLRILIDSLDEERIPIERDIQFFEHYFEALRLRREKNLSIHTNVDPELLHTRIPSMVLLVPFFEELFFGKYVAYLRNVKHVFYRSEKARKGYVHLSIEMSPVEITDTFKEVIYNDQMLIEINSLLESFKESSLAVNTDTSSLKFKLKMNLS